MTSKSFISYAKRAESSNIPIVKKIFEIAEAKRTNVVIYADMRNTKDLLSLADGKLFCKQVFTFANNCDGEKELGPYITVFKTHIDLISDFRDETVAGLKDLSVKHNFLIFEYRKFIDIGHTFQQQYHGGALRISEWAHIVNASILAGEGTVQALAETARHFPNKDDRALLILAEMTSAGSLATGEYTKSSINVAKRNRGFVIGFVATKSIGRIEPEMTEPGKDKVEDFVIFTTGVNRCDKGDNLDQQYQTPSSAIEKGADFIVSDREIYATRDPVAAVKAYRDDIWQTYRARIWGKDDAV